ncbi:MAG: dTDP-4-dehydrorhamnose reductase [Calditrichaeota bacterium]|nr:dTDP-4-dehydrorhamnose reductase [Calditrichota bacterium]
MKRVLITGANGLLGQKLITALIEDYELLATARAEKPVLQSPTFQYRPLNIEKYRECKAVIEDFQPDVIINAAAFTNVDACEVEKEACWRANVKGVENLVHASRNRMIQLIHISTDYIFDGKNGPYREDDRPNPPCYYGKAKLASENVIKASGIPFTIVRTSVVYGVGVDVKSNFFLWVYQNLKQGKPIRVVTDQYNTPTLVDDLAEGIHLILNRPFLGVIHISGADFVHRYQMAVQIAETFGFDPSLITPITTDQLQQQAPRPFKAGLKIDKAIQELGFHPKTLKESLVYLKTTLSK